MAVILDKASQFRNFTRIGDFAELNHSHVDLRCKSVRCVKNVRNSSAHAGSEVSTGGAENHHSSSSHILATMITSTFDNRIHTRIPHGESFSGDSTNKSFARSRSIETDISDDDILFGFEGGLFWRINDKA